MNFYTGYRQHNYHFIIYGALFLGQIAPALDACRRLRETTPEEMLRIESPPMADFFESYLAMEPHILIRFGRWREILALDLPEDPKLYATTHCNTLYAKALAHRQPRYEALARRGVTVTADAVAAVRSAEEFNEMIARALEAR